MQENPSSLLGQHGGDIAILLLILVQVFGAWILKDLRGKIKKFELMRDDFIKLKAQCEQRHEWDGIDRRRKKR
jgi:hypothetical protein